MNYRFYITLVIFSGLVFIKPVTAQSFIKIEGAQVFSTFKFSAKTNTEDKNSTGKQAYSRTPVSAFSLLMERTVYNGFFISGGVGMRKAGSALTFHNVNYLWEMQYFDAKVGLGYQFDKWRIKPYAAILPYYAYLLNAKQSIGPHSYDIKAAKTVKSFDLGLFLGLGLNATISKQISIFTEYNYILGLKNIETTSDQYLFNRGFSIKLGVSLNISNAQKLNEIPTQKQMDLLAETQTPPENNQNEAFLKIQPATNPESSSTKSTGNELAENNNKISKPKEKLDLVSVAPSTSPRTSQANTNIPLAITPLTANNSTKVKVEQPTAPNTSPATATLSSPVSIAPATNNAPVATKVPTSVPVVRITEKPINENNTPKLKETIPSTQNTSTVSPSNANVSKVPANNSSLKSPDEKMEKLPTPPNPVNNDVVFKIQLTAVKDPLRKSSPILKNITGRVEMEKGKDGYIRYYIGSFKKYEEIRAELNKVKSQGGAEEGFVVAFKNGKQINITEAKKLAK